MNKCVGKATGELEEQENIVSGWNKKKIKTFSSCLLHTATNLYKLRRNMQKEAEQRVMKKKCIENFVRSKTH